ncbi:hypothetical protein U1Q18_036321 [Sarracenia purpurea var. burkii]
MQLRNKFRKLQQIQSSNRPEATEKKEKLLKADIEEWLERSAQTPVAAPYYPVTFGGLDPSPQATESSLPVDQQLFPGECSHIPVDRDWPPTFSRPTGAPQSTKVPHLSFFFPTRWNATSPTSVAGTTAARAPAGLAKTLEVPTPIALCKGKDVGSASLDRIDI